MPGAVAAALELRFHGALELRGVPEGCEVVGDGAARVGRADFPVRRERGDSPGV